MSCGTLRDGGAPQLKMSRRGLAWFGHWLDTGEDAQHGAELAAELVAPARVHVPSGRAYARRPSRWYFDLRLDGNDVPIADPTADSTSSPRNAGMSAAPHRTDNRNRPNVITPCRTDHFRQLDRLRTTLGTSGRLLPGACVATTRHARSLTTEGSGAVRVVGAAPSPPCTSPTSTATAMSSTRVPARPRAAVVALVDDFAPLPPGLLWTVAAVAARPPSIRGRAVCVGLRNRSQVEQVYWKGSIYWCNREQNVRNGQKNGC